MMDTVKNDLNITLECVICGEHGPETEINNLTIKEIYREHYHILLFKTTPNIIVRYLEYTVVQQLKHLPVKGGISKYFISHMILEKITWIKIIIVRSY